MAEQLAADPTAILTLVTSQDAQRIAQSTAAKYCFTPPLAYCADLAAFVLATEAHIAALERRLSILHAEQACSASMTPEDEEALLYDHA